MARRGSCWPNSSAAFNFCVEEALNALPSNLKPLEHQIRLDCDEDLVLESNPLAFSQLITNLVTNSQVHGFEGQDGGVIEIHARASGDQLLLEYGDNGKGMSAEQVQRLFEPFYTTKRGKGGAAGLGGYIIYNVVNQKLKGGIRCVSRPHEGTRFYIDAPLGI